VLNYLVILSPKYFLLPIHVYQSIILPIDVNNSASSSLVFDESGDINVETNNNGTIRIKPQGTIWKDLALDPKLSYYRATLDYYGVLTQYSHPRDTKAKILEEKISSR